MPDSFWTRTRLKWTVIGQCMFTVGLLVVLLSLVIQWSLNRRTFFYRKENIVCLPCYKLKWSRNDDLTGFEQRNDSDVDYMTCCNIGSKVINRLVEKHAVSKHNDMRSTRILGSVWDGCKGKEINPQKPYVKMTGLNITATEKDTDDILQWHRTEYDGDVKPMNNSKIFIKEPGIYYVLSNFKLQIPTTNSSIVHSHYVYVHSYKHGSLKPILENSKSLCETTSAISETTSTVGGVFKLEKHDKLFVRSSHPQHLVSCEYSNVFAIYMM